MTTIYLGEEAVVSDYTANVRGTRAVVTVKITVSDSYALGYLLRDLEKSKAEAVARHKAAAAAATERKRAASKLPALEHQELRLLPYFGDRS